MLLRKNDSGRSIVEMLGVLAIMGVITVMGISGYSSAVGKMNRNSVNEAVVKLAQETRSLFAGQDNYCDGDQNCTAVSLDTKLTNMGNKLDNPYGTKYKIYGKGKTGANPRFYVLIPGVPLADCTQFMSQSWPDAIMATGVSGSGQLANRAYVAQNETAPDKAPNDLAGFGTCNEAAAKNNIFIFFR